METQQTAPTVSTDTNQIALPVTAPADIVRRAVPRTLPCKLTEEEFVRISRTRVAKESERDELQSDLDRDVKKRKEQIKEYDDEINKMRRELHSGYQDRTIKCNEVFEKDEAGNCWIVVMRLDTNTSTGERWPASPAEMQRYLPSSDGSPGGLLEQAAKVQRSAQPEAEVPADLPSGDDVADGDDKDESDADGGEKSDGKPKGKRNGKGK